MTRKAMRARKGKMRMWGRYKESKSYNDYTGYKRIMNKATKEYRKAKRKYERTLVEDIKKNPKAFYSYVRSKSKTKDVVGPLKGDNNVLVTDDQSMSHMLNN